MKKKETNLDSSLSLYKEAKMFGLLWAKHSGKFVIAWTKC